MAGKTSMNGSEQVRPLAPASNRRGGRDEEQSAAAKRPRRGRCVKLCTCIAVPFLLLAVVLVVLIFTVLKVSDPEIRMNGITVAKLELLNGTPVPRPGSNMTLIADVSVKNPNYASFKYENTTTTLFFHGVPIGEARGPSGKARARRTMRMNVTIDIMTDRMMSSPSLLGSGLLEIDSYTRVGGKVNVLNIKKHVTVRMNCSMTVNTTTQAIQKQKCKRKINL